MRRDLFPIIILLGSSTNAFTTPSTTKASIAVSMVDGGDLEDLEKIRQEFMSSIGSDIRASTECCYIPPALTSASRQRREIEIELLLSLDDSDDAIDELVSMWMTERDAESSHRLHQMENMCSPGLIEEEASLRRMIAEYGLHWPEPASRLAALLYFKGNSEESMVWADRVLQVKPWHFEVIHVQRLNCLRLKNGLLWSYARKALPPLNPTTRNAARRRWVARAVMQAKQLLFLAEEQHSEGRTLFEDLENIVWQ